MAHEIESMFSVVETPWHKLGIILDKPPTTAEAITAAGLDWSVEKRQLFLATGEPVKAFATVRASDDSILGHHVGPDYTLLQNSDAFAWFDPFLQSGEATLETAGSLRDGAVVWALARIGRADSIIVPRSDDRVAKYLLLSNCHTGREAVRVGFTPTRVVCANTLAMAHAGGESSLLRIKHTSSMHDTLNVVRDVINTANASFEATADQYRALARRQINARSLARYVAKVFEAPIIAPPRVAGDASLIDDILSGDELMTEVLSGRFSTGKEDRKTANARVRQEMITDLFEHGRGNDLPGVKGTWWAAYNGVTEYLQYEKRGTSESRIDSLTFGDGATKNKRALAAALEMFEGASA